MIAASARGAWLELDTRLRPFVGRRVRSPADVDDVVQDVFLRVQRGVGALHDEDRFGPWVYQVARSAIADHHRTASRHPVSDIESIDDALPCPSERADISAAEELAAYVAFFVAALPSPYREALTLTELEGLTQKDAASMLGISLSGMKSRVQRGRVLLRATIERACDVALDARGHVLSCEPRANGPLPDCRCR